MQNISNSPRQFSGNTIVEKNNVAATQSITKKQAIEEICAKLIEPMKQQENIHSESRDPQTYVYFALRDPQTYTPFLELIESCDAMDLYNALDCILCNRCHGEFLHPQIRQKYIEHLLVTDKWNRKYASDVLCHLRQSLPDGYKEIAQKIYNKILTTAPQEELLKFIADYEYALNTLRVNCDLRNVLLSQIANGNKDFDSQAKLAMHLSCDDQQRIIQLLIEKHPPEKIAGYVAKMLGKSFAGANVCDPNTNTDYALSYRFYVYGALLQRTSTNEQKLECIQQMMEHLQDAGLFCMFADTLRYIIDTSQNAKACDKYRKGVRMLVEYGAKSLDGQFKKQCQNIVTQALRRMSSNSETVGLLDDLIALMPNNINFWFDMARTILQIKTDCNIDTKKSNEQYCGAAFVYLQKAVWLDDTGNYAKYAGDLMLQHGRYYNALDFYNHAFGLYQNQQNNQQEMRNLQSQTQQAINACVSDIIKNAQDPKVGPEIRYQHLIHSSAQKKKAVQKDSFQISQEGYNLCLDFLNGLRAKEKQNRNALIQKINQSLDNLDTKLSVAIFDGVRREQDNAFVSWEGGEAGTTFDAMVAFNYILDTLEKDGDILASLEHFNRFFTNLFLIFRGTRDEINYLSHQKKFMGCKVGVVNKYVYKIQQVGVLRAAPIDVQCVAPSQSFDDIIALHQSDRDLFFPDLVYDDQQTIGLYKAHPLYNSALRIAPDSDKQYCVQIVSARNEDVDCDQNDPLFRTCAVRYSSSKDPEYTIRSAYENVMKMYEARDTLESVLPMAAAIREYKNFAGYDPLSDKQTVELYVSGVSIACTLLDLQEAYELLIRSTNAQFINVLQRSHLFPNLNGRTCQFLRHALDLQYGLMPSLTSDSNKVEVRLDRLCVLLEEGVMYAKQVFNPGFKSQCKPIRDPQEIYKNSDLTYREELDHVQNTNYREYLASLREREYLMEDDKQVLQQS